jgi:hypothetical protein
VFGIDSALTEQIDDFIVGIVVTEYDHVIPVSDSDEQEANRLLELVLGLPEIRDVIAEVDSFVSQPKLDVAATPLGSLFYGFHSNAFSPVTAWPRMRVWMSCVPS